MNIVRGTRVQANEGTPTVQGQPIGPPPAPWYPLGHVMPLGLQVGHTLTYPLAVVQQLTEAERQAEEALIGEFQNRLRFLTGQNLIGRSRAWPRRRETDAQYLQRLNTLLAPFGASYSSMTPELITALRRGNAWRRSTLPRGTVHPTPVYYGPVERHRRGY